MLTTKQMKFCEEYLRLDNATEAYIAAYQNKCNKASAQVEASRLLARDDIQAQILKLRKPVEKAIKRKILNEREYKKKLIQERVERCIEREDDAAAARWMEIWNKMDGEYVNYSKDLTERETDIQNLDNATLMKLAQGE